MTKRFGVGCILIIVFMLAIIAIQLKADDVYNFYFQKAPGPQTVYQGGGMPNSNVATPQNSVIQSNPQQTGSPSSATGSPESAGQSTIKAEAAKEEEDKGFRRWRFLFGKSSFSSGMAELNSTGYNGSVSQNGQWTLGIQFNIWRALGIELRAMQTVGQSISFQGGSNTLDYAAGLAFTPFHITIAGHDWVDISFTGGYMTVPITNVVYPSPYGDNYSSDIFHQGTYVLGAKGELNLGGSFAVVGSAEELPAVQASRLTIGAEFKL